MKRAAAVLLAVLMSAAAATLHAQPRARLIVGYMTDGELVPVGRYDGTNWRNTWPEPTPYDAPLPVRTVNEIPRSWLGQPVPLTWTAWVPSAGKPQRVTVTGIGRVNGCGGVVTL